MSKRLIALLAITAQIALAPVITLANEQLYLQLKAATLLDEGDCAPFYYTQRRTLDAVVSDTLDALTFNQDYVAGKIDSAQFDAFAKELNTKAADLAETTGCEGDESVKLINQARGYAWQRALRNLFIAQILFNLPDGHPAKQKFETIELNALGALKSLIERQYGDRAEEIALHSVQQAQQFLYFLYEEDPDIKGRYRLAPATPEFKDANVENSFNASLIAHNFVDAVLLEWSMAQAGFFARVVKTASGQLGAVLIPTAKRAERWEILNKTGNIYVQTSEGHADTTYVMANSPENLTLFLYGANYNKMAEGRAMILLKDGQSFSGKYRDCKAFNMTCFDFDLPAKQAVSALNYRDFSQLWLATKNAEDELKLADYMLGTIFGLQGR
jgi:hypothetical protein